MIASFETMIILFDDGPTTRKNLVVASAQRQLLVFSALKVPLGQNFSNLTGSLYTAFAAHCGRRAMRWCA